MKKNLNTSGIANELSSESAFFKRTDEIPVPTPVQDVQTVRNVQGVRPVPPNRNRIRHAFDIYFDQLEQLKKLKTEHMLAYGEDRSMSAMVREALDTFLEKNS